MQNTSSSQAILKNSLWIYFFSYLAAPLGYITRMIISRDVSVEELGILYTILGFIGLLSAYNGLGLTEALKYYIPKILAEKNINQVKTSIFMSFITQAAMSILIIGGLYFGSERLAINYFKAPNIVHLLHIFCLYFIGSNILQILSAIFLGFQDAFSNKLMDFLSILSTVLFTITIFYFHAGNISTYGIGRILGLGISILIGLFIYFKKYHPILQKGKIEWKSDFLKKF